MLLENRSTGHILVLFLFTETKVFIYQCSNDNYFEIQMLNLTNFSKSIHFSFIEITQNLSWYVKPRLSIEVHMTPDRN